MYEIIPVGRELAEKIKNNQHDISPWLKENKIKTLSENAFELFEKGITSLDEVYPLLISSI